MLQNVSLQLNCCLFLKDLIIMRIIFILVEINMFSNIMTED